MKRDPERADDQRTSTADDTALTKSHEALDRLRNVIVWLKLHDQRKKNAEAAKGAKAAPSPRENDE